MIRLQESGVAMSLASSSLLTDWVYLLWHRDCPRAEQHVLCSSDQRLPKCVFCRLVSAGRTGLAQAYCVCSICVLPWQTESAWPHDTVSRGLFLQRSGWICFLTQRGPWLWEVSSGHIAWGLMRSTVPYFSFPHPFFFFSFDRAWGKWNILLRWKNTCNILHNLFFSDFEMCQRKAKWPKIDNK